MTALRDAELEDHRRALVGLGYRMLGSVADAEDAAQEALLRLHQAEPAPDNPRGWLVTVTSRLCIDRLREVRARRAEHVGPWLPDFVLSPADPAADAERAEAVSLALLLVLESLTPAERAAFVLHDAFGYDYAALGEILDRTEAACRQLVSRARRHLQEGRPRFEPDARERAAVAQAFMQASAEGELAPLVELLADDVVLRSDAGGKRPAPRKALHGPDEVLRFMLGVRSKGGRDATFEPVTVNGTPGFVAFIDGEPDTIMGFDVAGGRVTAIHWLRDPDRVRAALASGGWAGSPRP